MANKKNKKSGVKAGELSGGYKIKEPNRKYRGGDYSDYGSEPIMFPLGNASTSFDEGKFEQPLQHTGPHLDLFARDQINQLQQEYKDQLEFLDLLQKRFYEVVKTENANGFSLAFELGVFYRMLEQFSGDFKKMEKTLNAIGQ